MKFYNYLNNRISNTENEFKIKIRDITALGAKRKSLGSTRHLLLIQELIPKQIDEFGTQMITFMMKSDPLHSPIKLKDFEASRQAVIDLQEKLVEEYNKLERNREPFDGSFIKVDYSNINLEKDKILEEINLVEATFRSKRSVLKMAFGDLRRGLFSSCVAVLFTLIGVLSQKIFDILKNVLTFF